MKSSPIHQFSYRGSLPGGPLFDPKEEIAGVAKGKEDEGKITLTKAEYEAMLKSKTDFEAAKTKMTDLEDAWSNMQVLLVEGHPVEKVRGAMEKLLLRQGYPKAKVEEMLNERFAETPEVQAGDETEDKSVKNEDIEQLRREVAQLKGGTAKERESRLKAKLDGRLAELVGSGSELGKMIDSISKFQARTLRKPEADIRKLLENRVREDLRREFVTELTKKKDQTNSWDDNWLDDPKVAEAASKRTNDGLRTVIGDPAILGRVPETAFADDEVDIIKSEPKKAPEYKKGMDVGTAQTELTDWATDTLTRSLMAGAAGGETRV